MKSVISVIRLGQVRRNQDSVRRLPAVMQSTVLILTAIDFVVHPGSYSEFTGGVEVHVYTNWLRLIHVCDHNVHVYICNMATLTCKTALLQLIFILQVYYYMHAHILRALNSNGTIIVPGPALTSGCQAAFLTACVAYIHPTGLERHPNPFCYDKSYAVHTVLYCEK